MENIVKTCGSCRYRGPSKGNVVGGDSICQRYPPIPIGLVIPTALAKPQIQILNQYPTVPQDATCGEWKAVETK